MIIRASLVGLVIAATVGIAACGSDNGQHVVPGQGGLDRLSLPGPEPGVAERLARDPVDARFVGQAPWWAVS
jgi:hypothetical protein